MIAHDNYKYNDMTQFPPQCFAAAVKADLIVHEMTEFRSAGAGTIGANGEPFIAEPFDRVCQCVFVVVDDGVAIRLLIAGEKQTVEREGLGIRGGRFFLQKAAECADFFGCECGEFFFEDHRGRISSVQLSGQRNFIRFAHPRECRALLS